MPHEIDTTTGLPAFIYNRQNGDPWHILGVPIEGGFSADEIMVMCPALNFTVELMPVFAASMFGGAIPIDGYMATVRTDTMKPLGVVSDSYHVYQHIEMFRFGEQLVDFGALYDTVGALLEGRLIFAQMSLGDDFFIPGDPSKHARRILLSTGHDGRHGFTCQRVQIRVVCWNTWNQAQGGVSASFLVRHTANMDVQVEQAKAALNMITAHDLSYVDAMTKLTKKKLTWAEIVAFTEKFLPTPDDGEKHTRIEDARVLVQNLYRSSPTLEGVDETAYRLFQASTEYADHFRTYRGGQKDEARALAMLDGAAAELKSRALALLQ